MLSPTLMCHQMSGSTMNKRAGTKTAPTISDAKTTGNENTRRRSCRAGDWSATPGDGTERYAAARAERSFALAVDRTTMSDSFIVAQLFAFVRKHLKRSL